METLSAAQAQRAENSQLDLQKVSGSYSLTCGIVLETAASSHETSSVQRSLFSGGLSSDWWA